MEWGECFQRWGQETERIGIWVFWVAIRTTSQKLQCARRSHTNLFSFKISFTLMTLINKKKGMTPNTNHQYKLSSEPRIHTNGMLPTRRFYFCASLWVCDMLLSMTWYDVKIWSFCKLVTHRSHLNCLYGEFPGSPAVRTQCSHCWGPGSIPGQGTRIPWAMKHGQREKKT